MSAVVLPTPEVLPLIDLDGLRAALNARVDGEVRFDDVGLEAGHLDVSMAVAEMPAGRVDYEIAERPAPPQNIRRDVKASPFVADTRSRASTKPLPSEE